MSIDYKNNAPHWFKDAIPTVLGWENPTTGEILVSMPKGANNPQPSKWLELHGFEDSITPPVEDTKLTLSQKTMALGVGGSKVLTATVTPSTATQEVTWAIQSGESVTIAPSGLTCEVTAVLDGVSVVSATWGEATVATCTATVTTG